MLPEPPFDLIVAERHKSLINILTIVATHCAHLLGRKDLFDNDVFIGAKPFFCICYCAFPMLRVSRKSFFISENSCRNQSASQDVRNASAHRVPKLQTLRRAQSPQELTNN